MLAKDLYNIISTESACVDFLKKEGLLMDASVVNIFCEKCASVMKETQRQKRLADGSLRTYKTLRCPKFNCHTFKSIRSTNTFFTFTDLNGRCNSHLSLGQILELIYYWAMDVPQNTAAQLTGRGSEAICDWYNLCRDVCVGMFEKREKMGAGGGEIQIDESLLRGKRKYNRGRLLSGDTGNEAKEGRKRNYGKRIEGPWVFGLCWRHDGILERRFFIVEKRNRQTLLPIIEREVEKIGTCIKSDEWGAYKCLKTNGFSHETVNHKKFFVNPANGTHTQTIECLWSHLKFRILRRFHGTSMLDRHLNEVWWRSMSQQHEYFTRILSDIRKLFVDS